MKHLFTILLLLFSLNISAQSAIVTGIVLDSLTKKPLPNTAVFSSGTQKTVLCDSLGKFKIYDTEMPDNLSFKLLGYSSRNLVLDAISESEITIYLAVNCRQLAPFTINANIPKAITKELPLYIKDYILKDDHIIALAYRDNMLSRSCLVMLNTDGKLIVGTPAAKPNKIIKDCYDNTFFFSRTDAFSIKSNSDSLWLSYKGEATTTEEQIIPVLIKNGSKIYLKQYYCSNQVLQYYYYDLENDSTEELCVISKPENLRLLKDKWRMVYSSSDPFVQERFEDLAFYKPVYAPIFKLNDSICIFNYPDASIDYYDIHGNLLSSVPASFISDETPDSEIFIDEIQNKPYACFKKNGVYTLKEIDLKTGNTLSSATIEDLPYIDKIKIYNGYVYFLYTDRGFDAEYKRLYKMKL